MKLRWLVLLVVVAVIAAVGVAFWRGSVKLPGAEGCTADAGGHSVSLDPEQSRNATLIAAIGVRRGLPARAVSIALATAFQESKIRNLTYGDRDSLGLFQQRPSQGWGTAAQVRDPYYAINAFYDVLAKVHGYQTMRITEAAQKVQRSGYAEAYQQHAEDARTLASVLTGYSTGGKFTCVVTQPSGRGTASAVETAVRKAYGDVGLTRSGQRQDLAMRVTGDSGNRLGWSVAQFLVARGGTLKQVSVSYDGKTWTTGKDSQKGWTSGSVGTRTRLVVRMG